MIGFMVKKLKFFRIFLSSLSNDILLSGVFASKAVLHFFKTFTSSKASLSFVVTAFFSIFSILLFITSKSASTNSIFITSISPIGSTLPVTCVTFGSLKHLTTSTMASHSLICDKNLLPSPSPSDAPATKPAISVNSNVVGTILLGLYKSAK